jgi:hypothetical protein
MIAVWQSDYVSGFKQLNVIVKEPSNVYELS